MEIKHRPGESNSNADALSKNLVGGVMVLVVQAEVAEEDQESVASEVKKLQRDDAECKPMLAYLEDGVLPVLARKITLECPYFEAIDGCLYHENPHRPGKWCLVPARVRPRLLHEAHAGHFVGYFGEKWVYNIEAILLESGAGVHHHCHAHLVSAS